MPHRLAPAALLALALTGCRLDDVKVQDVWFDRQADFAAMRTFAVRPIATSVEVSEALARDAEAAIREHLTGRGYREAEAGADFAVQTEIEFAAIHDTWRNERTAGAALRFTILRGDRDVEVWRALGSAQKAAKTTERVARIRQAVDLTLRRFPPKPEEY